MNQATLSRGHALEVPRPCSEQALCHLSFGSPSVFWRKVILTAHPLIGCSSQCPAHPGLTCSLNLGPLSFGPPPVGDAINFHCSPSERVPRSPCAPRVDRMSVVLTAHPLNGFLAVPCAPRADLYIIYHIYSIAPAPHFRRPASSGLGGWVSQIVFEISVIDGTMMIPIRHILNFKTFVPIVPSTAFGATRPPPYWTSPRSVPVLS